MNECDFTLIPIKRYEELVKAETELEILCRKLHDRAPWDIEEYRSIVGIDRLPLTSKERSEQGAETEAE